MRDYSILPNLYPPPWALKTPATSYPDIAGNDAMMQLARTLEESRRKMPRAPTPAVTDWERSGLTLLSATRVARKAFEFSKTESLALAVWILQYAIDRVWGHVMLTGDGRSADGELDAGTITIANLCDPERLEKTYDEFIALYRAITRKAHAA